MRELGWRSMGEAETESKAASDGTSAADEPSARLLALQGTAGNRAVAMLLRQPAPGQDVQQGSPAFEALYHRLWDLETQLVQLNSTSPASGERFDLSNKIMGWIGELGTPGERSDAEIAGINEQVDEFEAEREADRLDVNNWWKQLNGDYIAEQNRLAESKERSDVIASRLLRESYELAGKRMLIAGKFAWPFDVQPFAADLYERHHIQRGWELAMRETIIAAEKHRGEGPNEDAGHWPWPSFEIQHHLVHGAHGGFEGKKEAIEEAVDSAVRHNVDEAVAEMIALGESPDAAKAWAESALEKTRAAADELLERSGSIAADAGRWSARIHIAGKIVVAIDVIGSTIDIIASPPKERPKKILVSAARIVAGLAGAEAGGEMGARWGSRFGPEGAFVGGFIGAVAGGVAAAFWAEEIFEFIAEEIWPPEDTYAEVVAR